MRTRIMYIEDKSEGIAGAVAGDARIGRVSFSKSGKTLYYDGRAFRSLGGQGYKANYYDVETGESFWISGCRADGNDALYSCFVDIDDDVREEYWLEIRREPTRVRERRFRSPGKHTASGRTGDGKVGAEVPGRRQRR